MRKVIRVYNYILKIETRIRDKSLISLIFTIMLETFRKFSLHLLGKSLR